MPMNQKILVTGGLGYIGSHTVVELAAKGYEPLIIDNLSNSDLKVLDALEEIIGRRPLFEQVEMCDEKAMQALFDRHPDIAAAIHFAAFLLVNESVSQPVKYYHNNLVSTLHLVQCMKQRGIKPLVFSSSCTVYGNPDSLPVSEDAPIKPAISPYGNTKKMGEDILRDASLADDIRTISLRYFNPIGAHASAKIGEVPHGEPHHLVPYITETARGKRPRLRVFGTDYPTPDGSCVRDYIHVCDIAKAHVVAIERLLNRGSEEAFEVFNLGTGIGYSVLEMIRAFESATGIGIPYETAPRREGDVVAVYADTTRANTVLGWKAEKSLEDMLRSAWEWEKTLL
jgi:UDP-glucose 4-epimerase